MCVKQKRRCTHCTNCTTVWMSNFSFRTFWDFQVRWKHKKVPQYIDIVGLFSFCRLLTLFLCEPLGARTQDPNIKSVVLYLLS